MSQEQLNAQQVSARERQYEARIQAAIDSMGLRKWAVDLAYQNQQPGTKPVDQARAIYDFVTEPARQP